MYKPLRWANKSVNFKMIPSRCQLKSHVTTYSLPEKPVRAFMLLKHDVWVEVFYIKCVQMGVQATEMD